MISHKLQVTRHKREHLRRKIAKFLFLSSLFSLLFSLFCYAQDINFEVTVDKNKVSVGSSLQLRLTFFGTQEISTPQLPEIDGFDTQHIGPATNISIVNGRVSSSVTHLYRLIAKKEGLFIIPPLSITYKGQVYVSDPLSIEVVSGAVGPADEEGLEEFDPAKLKDRIFIKMEAGKTKAYVNEEIPITVRLYINEVSIRDILEYPQFAHEGFSVEDFEQAKQYRQVIEGIDYQVVEFNTTCFALKPGELELGPAELICNLIVTKKSRRTSRFPFSDDDFFGDDVFEHFFTRYQTYPLRLYSQKLPFTVLALPEEGRPADFKGALGDYSFELEVEPKEVKVGDPITLRMLAAGEGNLKTVTLPVIENSQDFKIYEPEVTQSQQSKLFEQVVIPTKDTILEIPRVVFSFFNPLLGEYKTLTQGPVPIKVIPLAPGEEPKVFEAGGQDTAAFAKPETLGKDIVYIKDSPAGLRKTGRMLYKNPLLLFLLLLPPVLITAVFIFQRQRQRLVSDVRYARLLRAPRKAKKNLLQVERLLTVQQSAEFFDAVFKTLQEYIGDKFHLPSGGITSSVVEELKIRGVNEKILSVLQKCFEECDRARYTPGSVSSQDRQKLFKLLQDTIEYLGKLKT